MGTLGTTTFRPPITPLTFGAIVGRSVGKFFDVVRKTSIHEWHIQNNAKFENVGNGKDHGTTLLIMKIFMKQFKEKAKLQEIVLEF